MTQWPVYILAGGRSSRFGSDKARAQLHGQALIVRVADTLSPIASRLTVVADMPGKYADLGLATIADRRPHQGPLGGLLTALSDQRQQSGDGWILLAACDHVNLQPEWLRDLATHVTDQVRCVAFRDTDWQPLPAFYHTSLIDQIDRLLIAGPRAMRYLLDRIPQAAVALPSQWRSINQINTAEDLQAAADKLG